MNKQLGIKYLSQCVTSLRKRKHYDSHILTMFWSCRYETLSVPKGTRKSSLSKSPHPPCLSLFPPKVMVQMSQENSTSYSIGATASSHQHSLPLIFHSEAGWGSATGREQEGADRVRCVSEMPAHSICRVFCVHFLLSSQAPNSAELKWNEVIRAAGCEDVLGLAYAENVEQEEKERREP